MEAFSDGVIAILITIMVLELKVPHGTALSDLAPLLPVILSYVLSYLYLGIYWNNHHHLLHTVHRVNGKILWANLALLFWLSLVPFVTSWMGQNHFGLWPVVCYGFILIMAAVAYYLLSRIIIASHGNNSELSKAIGSDAKGRISIVLYAIGIALSFIHPYLGILLYAIVAIIWLVPDKRIEKVLQDKE